MSTKVQLVNGGFQDSEGNVLANGYLNMELSQDSTVTGVGNIAAGITIRIQLDANGNVAGSPGQSVWGNDVLLPVNTFYKVTGYTAAGQPAWGPNNQQVTGSPTFDLGTWVPNQVISWTPPVQPITFKTNGVLNGSQYLLNLQAGANMSLSDNGSGQITLSLTGVTGITLKTNGSNNGSQTTLNLAAGTGMSLVDNGSGTVTVTNTLPAGSVTAGQNVVPLAPLNINFSLGNNSTINTGGATNTICQYVPGTDLRCMPSHWTVSLRAVGATTITAVMAKCLIGSTTVISTTPITFNGGQTSPTFAGAGTYTSDSIALALDTSHDYYILLNSSSGLFGLQQNGSGQSGSAAGVYVQASNFLSTSPLTFTGGTLEAGKALSVQFLSA